MLISWCPARTPTAAWPLGAAGTWHAGQDDRQFISKRARYDISISYTNVQSMLQLYDVQGEHSAACVGPGGQCYCGRGGHLQPPPPTHTHTHTHPHNHTHTSPPAPAHARTHAHTFSHKTLSTHIVLPRNVMTQTPSAHVNATPHSACSCTGLGCWRLSRIVGVVVFALNVVECAC
jgi:hypothetical protein